LIAYEQVNLAKPAIPPFSRKEVAVKVLKITFLACCLAASGLTSTAWPADEPAPKTSAGDAEKTMAKLAQLVGGTWINTDPKFVVENHFEWALGKKVIRGLSFTDKGGPRETPIEAILGQDPLTNTVYYLDCHGGTSVFKGTVKLEGEDLIFEFATIVGKPAAWREVMRFTDNDTMQFTIFGQKGDQWVPIVKQTSKRRQPELNASEQVTEGMIAAPVEAVWAAFTTKEGQESWNVAHAEIDLKIGGLMRTHYDAAGRIGDPNTIENTILSFEPRRMLAIQVKNPPEKFPYKSAIQKMWTVLYFETAGPSLTRLRLVGTGYGDDEESKKLRGFFERGNAYTLKKLQEKFAVKGSKEAKAG
jgi:uncharacterized protein YndB with AHSA1/START domain